MSAADRCEHGRLWAESCVGCGVSAAVGIRINKQDAEITRLTIALAKMDEEYTEVSRMYCAEQLAGASLASAMTDQNAFEVWARAEGHKNFMRMAGDQDRYDDLILRAQHKAWRAAPNPSIPAPQIDTSARCVDVSIELQLTKAREEGALSQIARINHLMYERDIARQVIRDAALAAPLAAPHRQTDDDLWDATLRDRDEYHEWADKLAGAVAIHFGAEIGEHSNQNCPWAEALEVIESADPISLASITDLISALGGEAIV